MLHAIRRGESVDGSKPTPSSVTLNATAPETERSVTARDEGARVLRTQFWIASWQKQK